MLKKSLLLLVGIFILQSCANKKDIYYYQDIKEGTQNTISYAPNEIQINDILYIKVDALVPETAAPFNFNTESQSMMNIQTSKIQGYLVSQEGTITMPILGDIKVAGISTMELQQMLTKILNEKGYVKEANVNVRIVNSKVTVLGEVRSPGTYSFDEQNISLNQAIGYAGDLTINGLRKDVLLIRENNGTRTYIKLDLTSSSWFTGPYYYVKQNDIIIVNPNGAKVTSSGYLTGVGSVLSVLTFGLTLYLLLKK